MDKLINSHTRVKNLTKRIERLTSITILSLDGGNGISQRELKGISICPTTPNFFTSNLTKRIERCGQPAEFEVVCPENLTKRIESNMLEDFLKAILEEESHKEN